MLRLGLSWNLLWTWSKPRLNSVCPCVRVSVAFLIKYFLSWFSTLFYHFKTLLSLLPLCPSLCLSLSLSLSLTLTHCLSYSLSPYSIKQTHLLIWQRVNHFEGSKELTRKDLLKRNIKRYTDMSGKSAEVRTPLERTVVMMFLIINIKLFIGRQIWVIGKSRTEQNRIE